MSSAENKAVFLSYASQDAEAARRICEALRAAGVEVWFDQSELVGGDQWDQKIRGQISSCALFVPVISANTQARLEGYFRLEWKLAAQRTHTMADEKAFLLPIVVDGTRDAEARVPAEFKAVQWTKLPGGETPPAFAARVKKLLGGTVAGVVDHPGSTSPATSRPVPARQGPSKWWWVLPMFGVAMALVLVLKEKRDTSSPGVPSAVGATPVARVSEARQLTARAEVLVTTVLTREGLAAAEELCSRALALDATDAEILAIAAYVDSLLVGGRFDGSERRRQQALQRAMKAKALAPDSYVTRSNYAYVLAGTANSPETMSEALQLYRELIREQPGDKRLIRHFGTALRNTGNFEEAAQLFERSGQNISAGWNYFVAGRFDEARRVATRQLANGRDPGATLLLGLVELLGFEDPEAAGKAVTEFSSSNLLEDDPAHTAMLVALCLRDPDRALAVVRTYPADFFRASGNQGPKVYYAGLAHEIAGRPEAAQAEWRLGLEQVRERRKGNLNDVYFLGSEVLLLACLGQVQEARDGLNLYLKLNASEVNYRLDYFRVLTALRLGQTEEAFTLIVARLEGRKQEWEIDHANIRLRPEFDPLRGDSRFERILRDNLPKFAKPFEATQPEANK